MKMIKGFQKDLNNTKTKGGENRMLRLMKKTSFLFVVLVCLALAGTASATLIPPQTTIGDIGTGSITIGDKEFSGFSITGGNINPFDVTVRGEVDGNVVNIIFGGPIRSFAGEVDYQLNYVVHATDGLIESIDQRFTLTAQGNGGSVGIGETVYDSQHQHVAQSSIGWFFMNADYEDPPGEPNTGDQLLIGRTLPNGEFVPEPLSTLWVTKDIFLIANEGGMVGATELVQSFHQVPVPEPSILLMLGTGFASLAFYARRKRQ
jgi:hypothetical protein